MKFTDSFSINEIGKTSGRLYTGTFEVKLVLTRADQFAADRRRREILGPNPDDALAALKLEAFMHGQLSVRVLKAPQFWTDSNGGLLLEDFEIVQLVYDQAVELEQARIESIRKETEETLKSLAQRETEKETSSSAPTPKS